MELKKRLLLIKLIFCVICLLLPTISIHAQSPTPTPPPTATLTADQRLTSIEVQLNSINQLLTMPTPTLLAENRIQALETQVTTISDQLELPQKDIFDILSIMSTMALTLVGLYAAHVYHQHQQTAYAHNEARDASLTAIQILQGFMPHLHSSNSREVEGALLAIRELGNEKLAIAFASLYQSDGALLALIKIISTETPDQGLTEAREALERTKNSYRHLLISVVRIQSTLNQEFKSTGFIVHESGKVITTNFAVNDEPYIKIFLENGNSIEPTPCKYLNDGLALLEVSDNSDHKDPPSYAQLVFERDNGSVRKDDELLILGVFDKINEVVCVKGYVESINEKLSTESVEAYITARFSVVSSSFRGSPVINQSHRVIGIVDYVAGARNGSNTNIVYIRPLHAFSIP